MKKVLFMLSSMNIGGVEKSLLSLLAVMPKDKYDITLLLLEKKGGFLPFVPEWVKVEEATWYKQIKPTIMQPPQMTIKSQLQNKELLKIPRFVYAYIMAEKLLKNRMIFYKNTLKQVPAHEEEFDVAIAYQGPTDIIDYFIAHKVNASKKVSWVHFDVANHYINKKLYTALYKKMDKVYVVSKAGKQSLLEAVPSITKKVEVFQNIVSENFIRNLANKQVSVDTDYKGIKIVTVGRLSKEKGQDMAIKALSLLRKNRYEAKWYCVGEGSHRQEYQQSIEKYGLKEHFILLGEKTNPYPLIQMADIYVQPSRHEGFCLTLAEAKCLKKPIVTTDFIGAYEQITDEKDGLIVEANEHEIFHAIKRLLNNPNLMKTFTCNLYNNRNDTIQEVNKLYQYIDNTPTLKEACTNEGSDSKITTTV